MFRLISKNELQKQKQALTSMQAQLAAMANDRQDLLDRITNLQEKNDTQGDALLVLLKENEKLVHSLKLANEACRIAEEKLVRISHSFNVLTGILEEKK